MTVTGNVARRERDGHKNLFQIKLAPVRELRVRQYDTVCVIWVRRSCLLIRRCPTYFFSLTEAGSRSFGRKRSNAYGKPGCRRRPRQFVLYVGEFLSLKLVRIFAKNGAAEENREETKSEAAAQERGKTDQRSAKCYPFYVFILLMYFIDGLMDLTVKPELYMFLVTFSSPFFHDTVVQWHFLTLLFSRSSSAPLRVA